MKLSDIYQRSPVAVQNAFATGYGLRERARRYGGTYSQAVDEIEQRQWWPYEDLLSDQASRLRRMVTWSATRVPHYRDLFAELGLAPEDVAEPADLALLPILDKEAVRADPERFLPDAPRPKLIAQTTGGTTGTPLAYWATIDAVRRNYATYEVRSRRWAGIHPHDRIASFQGQPIVPASVQHPPFWRYNPAFHQLYCSVYHLNDANLPAYVDALARFDPGLVTGYTSAVHRVAQHLLERGDVGRVTPRGIIVSSETLLPGVRADIEAAFGAKVTNSYSLGELVAWVSECPEGHLHVSTDFGVLELVPRPDGLTEIVATGLTNRGMPLLRYRTGDLAAAQTEPFESCGRGLPVLASLTGRIDDVVRTPEGAAVGPAPMSLAFQRVPRLRRAQVRQATLEEIDVAIEVDPSFTAEDQGFLEAELRKRLGPSLRMHIHTVDAVPRTSGGKERLIVSTLGGHPSPEVAS